MRTHFITSQEQRPSMLHKHRISLIATAQIRTAYTIYIIYTRAHPQSLHHNPQPTQRNDRTKSQTWHTARSVRTTVQRIRLPSHEGTTSVADNRASTPLYYIVRVQTRTSVSQKRIATTRKSPHNFQSRSLNPRIPKHRQNIRRGYSKNYAQHPRTEEQHPQTEELYS